MKTLLSLFVLALCAVSVHSQQQTCLNVLANATAPGSLTKLQINYPSSLPIQIQYYASTSGKIEADVTWCSTDATLIDTFKSLIANISNEVEDVLLYLGLSDITLSTSAASKGATASISLLLTAFFGAFFLFPKSRVSAIVLLAICIALCAPSTTAEAANNVTVRVGLPSSIMLVCENSRCFTPNTTSSSTTGTPSSTDGSASSTTGDVSPTNAPTDAPTDAPTVAPTNAPTLSPAATHFNLRVLILSAPPKTKSRAAKAKKPKDVLGADFATLAFESVGMPYDYYQISSTTDLAGNLSTSGVGLYSGIVSVFTNGVDPLTAAQNQLIVNYQLKYGVKWVIVGCTSISGLSGVSAGASIGNEYFDVTLAPEFNQYGKFLNPTISVNTETTINFSDYTGTPSELLPITITDSSKVTPMLMASPKSGKCVAAAAFKMTDGTQQLRYFLTQGADYIHSMAFASVMVNWISPGGLFIGSRRITFSVQPDDLFLGSYIWNVTTHSNPTFDNSTWYRITDYDLQGLADFFDEINPTLPKGSYITVEWPTNFGGVNNSYYTRNETDYLYLKSLELKDKFYYLSHTWDHPCTFDNMSVGYDVMNSEVSQNIAFAPGYFRDRMDLWSNNSMITPCVTGLYNGNALRAMSDNKIFACVSDESVGSKEVDYEPITPYHGVYSNTAKNGFEGMYFVPREALDIDYSAMTPEMAIDNYLTMKDPSDPVLDFEGLMALQQMDAIQDKIAFRHDPFMMHQTNVFQFTYDDPTSSTSYNTSLVALFMKRVVQDIQKYYSLPIVSPQMDTLVKIFQQRQTMDNCGATATLGVSATGQIVDIAVVSKGTCQLTISGGVELSGSTVRMEKLGVETTAFIDLTAGAQQGFTLSTPINL